MSQFLIALLLITAAFVQFGQPSDEVQVRGKNISGVVGNQDPENPDTDSQDNAQVESNENDPEAPIENGNLTQHNNTQNVQDPDTNKVTAYNNQSEREMPTTLPQVAIDRSEALDESQSQGADDTGQHPSENIENETNDHADFGLGIAESQPDAAKTDGRAFGEETSSVAQNNARHL